MALLWRWDRRGSLPRPPPRAPPARPLPPARTPRSRAGESVDDARAVFEQDPYALAFGHAAVDRMGIAEIVGHADYRPGAPLASHVADLIAQGVHIHLVDWLPGASEMRATPRRVGRSDEPAGDTHEGETQQNIEARGFICPDLDRRGFARDP